MKFIIISFILSALLVSMWLTTFFIKKYGQGKAVSPYRLKYIARTINIVLTVVYSAILVTYLSLEYSQIWVFLSSIFAILGVALFAQWSMLSNITASLIIFFGFPYRVGDHIRVVDKDENIDGIIDEIALFHVLIKRGEELICYPNTLMLQKPIIKIPRLSENGPPTD
jgi:small-conductance mechanosensitive channel